MRKGTRDRERSWWSQRMSLLPVAAAAGILMLSGLVNGIWVQRWGTPAALTDAARRINDVPLRVGNWEATVREMDPEIIAISKLSGCWMRTYVHRDTGEQMTVLLMCGRAGPTSAHTPDWCYRGAGYEMEGEAIRFPLEGERRAEFWTARFQKPAPADSTLRIFWSWNATGAWQAPDYPRLTFGHQPALYKLYCVRQLDASDARDPNASVEFLRLLLPQIDQTIFPHSNLK